MSRGATLPLQPPLLFSRNNPHGRKARFIIGLGNNPIPYVEQETDADASTAAAAIGALSPFSSAWETGAEPDQGLALGRVDPALLTRLRRNMFFSLPSAYNPSGQLNADTIRTLDYFKSLKNVSKTFYSPPQNGPYANAGLQPEEATWRNAFGDFCRPLVTEPDASAPVPIAQPVGSDGLTYEEREEVARRTAQYSPKTGRLMPKSPGYRQRRIDIVRAKLANGEEKAQSRRPLRATQKVAVVRAPAFAERPLDEDALGMDCRVLRLLGQILQTTDVNAVYFWLLTAPEAEKAAAQMLIRSALTAPAPSTEQPNERSEEPNVKQEEPQGAQESAEAKPDVLLVHQDEGVQWEPEPENVTQTARPQTRRRVSEPQFGASQRSPRKYSYTNAPTPGAKGNVTPLSVQSKTTTPRLSSREPSRRASGLNTFRESASVRQRSVSVAAMPAIREEATNSRQPQSACKKSAPSRESPPQLENSADALDDVDRLVLDR